MSEPKVLAQQAITKEYRVVMREDGQAEAQFRSPGEEWSPTGGRSHYSDELARLAAEVKGKDEDRDRLRKEVENLRCRVTQLESGYDEVSTQRNRLAAEVRANDAEIERLRETMERIEGMAVRPVCRCGRKTGTAAIRFAARRALAGERADGEETVEEQEARHRQELAEMREKEDDEWPEQWVEEVDR